MLSANGCVYLLFSEIFFGLFSRLFTYENISYTASYTAIQLAERVSNIHARGLKGYAVHVGYSYLLGMVISLLEVACM
jgi:hypothetical protein